MSLRFQSENDEVDQAVKNESHTVMLVFILGFIATIDGVFEWFQGKSLAEYGKNLGWWIGFGLAYWLACPFYNEFRFRTKELDGKVSAIEQTVIAFKEYHGELIEKLESIEQKLDEASARLKSLNPDANEQTIKWDDTKRRGLPADIATEYDISRAVSKAIQETRATSFAETGLVMKAARSHLKGKSFDEMELQSAIAQVDFLRRPSVSAS